MRITPLFRKPDGTLEEHVETSLIDGEFEDCLIIRVPPTTSVAQARDIEQRLTTELKKNCIVVTRNIEFCKVEPVDPKELAHLLKGVDRHVPSDKERQAVLSTTIAGTLAGVRRTLSEPVDPDCANRGTTSQDECADGGCGFCIAARDGVTP